MSERKKPGVPFWATVVVVVMVAYLLSWGPWCWALGKWGPNRKAIRVTARIYEPIMRLTDAGPLRRPLEAYRDWWFERGYSNPDHIPTPSPAAGR